MTAARKVMISLYAMAYLVATYAGASALGSGNVLYAAGLFGTSAGLILGVHREMRHAALLIHVAVTSRNGVPYARPMDDLVAIERAMALPPGCRCETWWSSLGTRHDRHCPALAWKDMR